MLDLKTYHMTSFNFILNIYRDNFALFSFYSHLNCIHLSLKFPSDFPRFYSNEILRRFERGPKEIRMRYNPNKKL